MRPAADEPQPTEIGIERLKRRADFLRVAGARRKHATVGLILQVAPQPKRSADVNPDAPVPVRVGFTASRKVGNSVTRNRAKRRLRAAMAEVMTGHAVADHDYVLIARDNTPGRPWKALLADLEQAMKRLKAWR